MVQRLGVAGPDLGRHTAGASTGLTGRHEPNGPRREAEIADGLPQARGGRKEYADAEGRVTKMVEWFGYKLYLLVDVAHEVVLSYHITDPKAGDNECIATRVERAQEPRPEGRIETLAYDEAADGRHEGARMAPRRGNRAFNSEPRVLAQGLRPTNGAVIHF